MTGRFQPLTAGHAGTNLWGELSTNFTDNNGGTITGGEMFSALESVVLASNLSGVTCSSVGSTAISPVPVTGFYLNITNSPSQEQAVLDLLTDMSNSTN